eukprot:5227201-Prymnesium_polylepis.1
MSCTQSPHRQDLDNTFPAAARAILYVCQCCGGLARVLVCHCPRVGDSGVFGHKLGRLARQTVNAGFLADRGASIILFPVPDSLHVRRPLAESPVLHPCCSDELSRVQWKCPHKTWAEQRVSEYFEVNSPVGYER